MEKLIELSDKIMTDGKSIIIMILLPLSFCGCASIYSTNKKIDELNNRIQVCNKYINELEYVIETNGICLEDVCGGDGYVEYYNK